MSRKCWRNLFISKLLNSSLNITLTKRSGIKYESIYLIFHYSEPAQTFQTEPSPLLTLSTVDTNFSRRQTEIFFLFSLKTGFDISCKLSPLETIRMKCQILFSWKNKKKKSLICRLLNTLENGKGSEHCSKVSLYESLRDGS